MEIRSALALSAVTRMKLQTYRAPPGSSHRCKTPTGRKPLPAVAAGYVGLLETGQRARTGAVQFAVLFRRPVALLIRGYRSFPKLDEVNKRLLAVTVRLETAVVASIECFQNRKVHG